MFILDMLGGLALFLYGMNLLGNGLEKASGGRLEQLLEKLSGSTWKAVLLGAFVTAAVQSSSATTVIVVGLVSANVIRLRQAIGVIMGANIGTTITAHILRLSAISSDSFFLTMLKPKTWTPIMLVLGVLMVMGKKKKHKELGGILLGFGVLFVGMFNMSAAVAPLGDNPAFMQLFELFSNPIAGVLVGAVVTAIVQSSSASVGILQALASTGAITSASAFPIIMGQNIGTCITPILASIGAKTNAKRSAFVHLSFNVIGTLFFLIATYVYQYTVGFSFWNSPIDAGGIADFHTVFNITVTALLLPFTGLLEKLAIACVRDKKTGQDDSYSILAQLDPRFLVSPGLALEHTRKTIIEMGQLAQKNYYRAICLIPEYDEKRVEKINDTEDVIDAVDSGVNNYLLELSGRELSDAESQQVTRLLQICNEIERLGDYATNIVECAQSLHERGGKFSPEAMEEIDVIGTAVTEIMARALEAFENDDAEAARSVEPLEEVIDSLEEALKARHMERMKMGLCSGDIGYLFMDCLSHFERMSDHCSNVAIEVICQYGNTITDKHEYTKKLHNEPTKEYSSMYAEYQEKYYSRLRKIGA